MGAFDFTNYEDFFNDVLKSHDKDRGYRTRLAHAIRVNPSYITRICQGTASITPDQAAALAEFWGMEANEKEYFLWLVLKGRSGDPAMKKIADEKLRHLKSVHEDLGHSLGAEKIESDREYEYYMSWIYSAIHMFSTLKNGISIEALAKRLALTESTLKSMAQSLERMGFIEIKNERIQASRKNVHLKNQSWMAPQQHRNWRIAALERIGRPNNDSNYTGVHSISKKDLEKLRRQIREFLVQTDKLVRPSEEETVCVMTLDLFEL